MRRVLASFVLSVALAALVQAHAPYIVAEGGDPAKAIVIFSDDLKPDERIKEATWKKMSGLKLTARTANGQESPVAWTQAEHFMKAPAPAGTQVINGTVTYGTFAKGENKPALLVYYPRAILGEIPADGGLSQAPGMQILPKVEAGKVRFQVLVNGKPVKDVKVSVMIPEGNEKGDAVTDEQGLTQAFSAKGRYGVTARLTEPKGGEHDGVKYETTMHIATLVVDVK